MYYRNISFVLAVPRLAPPSTATRLKRCARQALVTCLGGAGLLLLLGGLAVWAVQVGFGLYSGQWQDVANYAVWQGLIGVYPLFANSAAHQCFVWLLGLPFAPTLVGSAGILWLLTVLAADRTDITPHWKALQCRQTPHGHGADCPYCGAGPLPDAASGD